MMPQRASGGHAVFTTPSLNSSIALLSVENKKHCVPPSVVNSLHVTTTR